MAEGASFLSRRRPPPASAAVEAEARRARFHGYAEDDAVAALMARAAITLGVNQRTGLIGDPRGFADSRLRDFEAPMAGAFYLVQTFIDLPAYYEPGVEVETWSTLDELKRKVAHYIDRPDERRAIAEAGRARARAEHTWDHRLAGLLHRLGIDARKDGIQCPLEIVANLSSRPWCTDAPGCRPDGGDAAVPEPELDSVARRA